MVARTYASESAADARAVQAQAPAGFEIRGAQEAQAPVQVVASLPPNFCPLDATIDEVASFRRESRWTVHAKLKNGCYEGYHDGRIHKVIFASVLRRPRADHRRGREREEASGEAAGRPSEAQGQARARAIDRQRGVGRR